MSDFRGDLLVSRESCLVFLFFFIMLEVKFMILGVEVYLELFLVVLVFCFYLILGKCEGFF